MKYAKVDPEFIRKGLLHSEYVQDVELLAYDMARLGCEWHEFKKILKDLIVSNLQSKGVNRYQIALRMGLVPNMMYRKKKKDGRVG